MPPRPKAAHRLPPDPTTPRPPWADVLASIDDGIVVLDAACRILEVNPAAEALVGGSAAHLLGQEVRALLRGRPENQWLGDLVEATVAEGGVRRRGEGVLAVRAEEVPVAASCAPVHDAEGGFRGAVLVLRDLTLQRTLEATARRGDRLAALGTVALGLAHEIRNPLGGIKGAAQLLRTTLTDPDQIRATEIVVSEVERLDALVEQLRELARPPHLQVEAVNIHRILNDVLSLQRRSPAWGAVTLRTEFDPSLPAVRGDRAQLTQVFLNLVKNALEALDGRGELCVSTRFESRFHIRRGRARGQFLVVRVADTGPGVAETDQAQLFAPFFTTKPRGTGLGLAVCHRIVSEHGGTITYEPRRGGGACFRVTLPVTDDDVGDGR